MKTKLEIIALLILTFVLGVFLFPLILNDNQILASETEFQTKLQIPGRIEGTTYIDKDTTLNQDIAGSIEIVADNVILDCQNYNIVGDGTGYGIYLNNREGVTIKNCKIKNFSVGISLEYSSNIKLIGNEISENEFLGIWSQCSSNNQVSENKISNNWVGIYLTCLIGPFSNTLTYHNNLIANEIQVIDEEGDNLFDNGHPSGGNYWSDYKGKDEKSGPNQDQSGPDGIGDTPYIFYGGQDRYPFMRESGWEVPVNQPPTISNLGQFKSDGIISITEGNTTTESTVVFKAILNDPENDQVKLQIEPIEKEQPFNEQELLEGGFVSSGVEVTLARYGLINGQYHWRARAMDEKGNISDWQEFGEVGNVDFEVKIVPLYTQVRSLYPSDEETRLWFDEYYAKAPTETYFCGSKIYQCGCAITSIVMIARYYDVLETQEKDVNPGEINNWLKSEPGGYQNGDVNWVAAAKYTNWRIKYEGPDTTINNYALLDEKLNNNQPVIAKEINPGHFIVIDNKLATTYGVKDPSWYNTKKLDELTTDWSSKIRDYNNNFYGLKIYKKGDGIAQSAITFALGSLAELLLTDPQGRKLGKDENGIEYNEIPDAWYFEDGFDDPTGENPPSRERNKLIQILEPIDGKYQLQVIGMGEGNYILQSSFYDTQGQVNSQEFQSETAIGYIAQYDISFDSSDSNNTIIELFDETPPEAEIYFNSDIQQLEIKGTDDTTVNPVVSLVVSEKKQTIYQIKDEVGNTIKLIFEKLKQKGKEIKAELKSIQYDSNPIIHLPETEFKYEWSLDKKTNQIKELEQRIKAKDTFDIKAKYNHQKNETKIKIKQKNKEELEQTLPGLVIVKLITKSGVLRVSY